MGRRENHQGFMSKTQIFHYPSKFKVTAYNDLKLFLFLI